jgi:hypothetical protein
MKRLALIVLALLVPGLVAAAPGATAPGQALNWGLQGTAEWSGSGFLAENFAIHGEVVGAGTYSGTLSAGPYFTTETCGPQCAPVTGAIDFVTWRGDLSTIVEPDGLVTVLSIGSGTTYYFTLDLAIVGGTRAYSHATGTLSVSYASHQPTSQPDCIVCPIEDGGTLTGSIAHGPLGAHLWPPERPQSVVSSAIFRQAYAPFRRRRPPG